MKSIVLINCYFGNYPNYFNLFLESCRKNSTVNFLLFTDNEISNAPENVTVINISFIELRNIIQNKFDFKISLDAPYKLCDYKPAYGYIFDDYIYDFDYWGYCDVDMIFGNIRHFITDDVLVKYDKFYKLGHLTLFRNTKENNQLFMNDDIISYKQAFTTKKITVFDEFQGIQIIFDNLGKETYFSRDYADITAMRYRFTLSDLLVDDKNLNNYQNQIFTYEDGCVFRYYEVNGEIKKEEFEYIHLQKRHFKETIKEGTDYLITNVGFIPKEKEVDLACMKMYNGIVKRKELLMKFKTYEFKIKRKISKMRLSIDEYFTSSANR